MCWPRLEGGLEIEERYPRTHDLREPRRKRLNFVRSSSRSRRNSSSDDYALMHSSFYNARPIRASEREQHDPQMLQQREQAMRQLQGQNHEMHQQLQWHEMRRQHEIEQAHRQQQQMLQQQAYGQPPPPPPIPQPRLQNQPHHDGFAPGIEVVRPDGRQAQANLVEIAPRPRSRMPNHLQHGGRSPSRGRSHRRHHSGASIFSDDCDSYRDVRRRHRSPVDHGSSHDSFDDLMPSHPRRR